MYIRKDNNKTGWADLEEIPVEVHVELSVVSEVKSQFSLRIRVNVLPENVPI
jgi:hypothetical protein